MNARTTLAVIAGAALALAVTPSPAFACPSGEALDNYILPNLPKSIDADAIGLKVLLKKIPDWRAQPHPEANMSVLGVVKGPFLGRSIWLAIRPKGSCEIVGVVGRPGYVVVKHYPSGWIVSPYRVVRGRTTTPGAAEIPF